MDESWTPAAVMPPAIAVEEIVKRYGTFEAVKGVSFSVNDGEIFGLLGPNGAGKSTLIRMMTTLVPITAGRALVAGHDVAKDADAVRRVIGVIPQALTSDPDLTLEENLSIYAKLYGVPKALRAKNIQEVLEAVDLVKWRDAPTKTLSGADASKLRVAWCIIRESSFSMSRRRALTRYRALRCGRCLTTCGGRAS
jgi:ABC-2 type transport system ATP-binding protein